MTEQDPHLRLEYEGSMEPVFKGAARAFNIGKFKDYEVVPIGYEDFNAIVRTNEGTYFSKVFAGYRSADDVGRYKNIMQAVVQAGVSHPRFYEAENSLVYTDGDTGLSMVVMDFVSGKTFYEMERTPSQNELHQILSQTVAINKIPHRPPYLEDSWAIPNLKETYALVKDSVGDEDKKVIEKVVEDLERVDIAALPHSFVHGDIVKSNVLKGDDGKMYILDFSVANWCPRIQELAVIVGNLMNSVRGRRTFESIVKDVVYGYVMSGGELTTEEMDVTVAYSRAAYASEFVGAVREQVVNHNNTQENDYWLRLGRAGLHRAMIEPR